MDFGKYCEELEKDIQDAYESSTTIEQAERLAAKFLQGQLIISTRLRDADLDARMKKSGVKAIKAAVYLDEAKKETKKPSDVMLEALVNSSKIVQDEQGAFDEAEVVRDRLQDLMNVCREAHVFFRGIAKGRFE